MQEIELKFQVPAARRDAVAREVAGRAAAPAVRLAAAYFDTPDRRLAEAGLALRLRREGLRWVQTLKGAATDGLTRLEHNAPRPGRGSALPSLDLSLHAGTPAGERLAEVLEPHEAAELKCLFRTDIRRLLRRVRTRLGTVELAFDSGQLVAADARVPVCELEIELVSGSPLAVMTTARRWIDRHGLWLDTRSKAERGDLLSRGLARAPERKAQPVSLKPRQGLETARRSVLTSCFDQVSVNASQVAAGDFGAEHVHQLRVGLRRLRTALRFLELPPDATDTSASATLASLAEAWFRQLGAARDQAAIAGPMSEALQQALHSVGLDLEAPRLPAASEAVDPVLCSRCAPAQHLLLDLLMATHLPMGVAEPGGQGTGSPEGEVAADRKDGNDRNDRNDRHLRELLSRRLNRWHRDVVADVARFATLDETQRHRLRKRAKRLRYAAEFAASLFPDRAVKRYLKPLRALQVLLGDLNDVALAIHGYQALSSAEGPLFALGWLAARRDGLLASSAPVLEAFARARRFWR